MEMQNTTDKMDGLGYLERSCMQCIQLNGHERHITAPGQRERDILVIQATFIACSIFGDGFSRSQIVSIRRALKELDSRGLIHLHHIIQGGRRYLFAELASPGLESHPHVDKDALKAILKHRVELLRHTGRK